MPELSLRSLRRRHPMFAAFRAGADAQDLFVLRLRDFIGNPLDLGGTDFREQEITVPPLDAAAVPFPAHPGGRAVRKDPRA